MLASDAQLRSGSSNTSLGSTTNNNKNNNPNITNSSNNAHIKSRHSQPISRGSEYSSHSNNSSYHRQSSSTLTSSPKREMPVPIFHVATRVPQSYEGYQTRSVEALLIKDLLYTFQGIDGTILKSTKDGSYEIVAKEFVNPCIRQEAIRLSCLGNYYKIIKTYRDKPMTGIMLQSFKHGLEIELHEYYRILALIQKAIMSHMNADTPLTEELPQTGDEPSLLNITVWIWDVRKRFQFITGLIKSCGDKKGGELCSAIFPYSEHGCPTISSLSISLLSIISKPLYAMICEWILYGELEDPFNEFFIATDHSCRQEDLWHSKYTMREKMLPEFISRKLADRILATGKNINFLKELCHNSAGYNGRDEIEKNLKETPVECLFLRNDPILHKTIEKAYETTSSMVLSVLMEQSRLVDHLTAIKNYLLLGQGDFIQYLLELIQLELSKPASKVFYHNLSAILESAVRSTNAQYEDEEILSRLDVRLLPSTEKDIGWDVFCLDYKVQGPIGTVLTDTVMGRYNQLFNTLWRTKRIETILSALWKSQTALFKFQRTLPELGAVLHRSQLLISEMIHFVHQTQYYIMFEATECAWNRLMIDVAQSTDLDEVIRAHESFLDTITNRSLLSSSSRDLLNQLRGIFDVVHDFEGFLSKFDHAVMKEYERRKGEVYTAEQLREAQKEFFRKLVSQARGKVETLYTTYQDLVRTFLLKLNRQQDITLQCLSFRLDFNEHYQQKDARLTQPLTFQHRRLSMGPFSPLNNSMLMSSMEESYTNNNNTIPEELAVNPN